MSTNQKDTASTTHEPAADSVIDLTPVADAARVGFPVSMTKSAWERWLVRGSEKDFPGRTDWMVFEMMKMLALYFRLGPLLGSEASEFRWVDSTGCEYFGEVPGDEVPLKAVLGPDNRVTVMLDECNPSGGEPAEPVIE